MKRGRGRRRPGEARRGRRPGRPGPAGEPQQDHSTRIIRRKRPMSEPFAAKLAAGSSPAPRRRNRRVALSTRAARWRGLWMVSAGASLLSAAAAYALEQMFLCWLFFGACALAMGVLSALWLHARRQKQTLREESGDLFEDPPDNEGEPMESGTFPTL